MENKRKKSFGIINFIKDNRIEIVCGCCCCLVLFVGIMAIKEVCDPAFLQKMQQEEQRQDSIRKVEALRADSIRKVEAQIQPEKTMVSCINDNGTKVKNSSKELEAIEPSDALIFFFVCLELVVAVFACVIFFSNCTCGCCESGGTRRSEHNDYYSEKERDLRTMSFHDWTQKYWSIDD